MWQLVTGLVGVRVSRPEPLDYMCSQRPGHCTPDRAILGAFQVVWQEPACGSVWRDPPHEPGTGT